MNSLWRRFAKIPKEDFMAVGIEAERQFPFISLLDVVAILFGLFAPYFGVCRRFLGLDYGDGFAVFAKQNVVAELTGAKTCRFVTCGRIGVSGG
jgi:hypothetical protein